MRLAALTRWIGQAHLLPEMSLHKFGEIEEEVLRSKTKSWDVATPYKLRQLKARIEEECKQITKILEQGIESDEFEIKVKDNGKGISREIVDKIFQPFFTTKPTGQGTGLGLSLAYDIVKAHQGELRVESEEGEGATFTITLPKA